MLRAELFVVPLELVKVSAWLGDAGVAVLFVTGAARRSLSVRPMVSTRAAMCLRPLLLGMHRIDYTCNLLA